MISLPYETFPGHSATLGCSKCKQSFRSPNASKDVPPNYSEFDRQKWPARDLQAHKTDADRYLMAKSEVDRAGGTGPVGQAKTGPLFSAVMIVVFTNAICMNVVMIVTISM